MSGPKFDDTTPAPPRRLFLAAALAALAAGGAAALGIWGQVTAPGTETFRFARGTTLANGEEARLRNFLDAARQDDRVSVLVMGHTGTTGDPAANFQLGIDRASVVTVLAVDMGIDANRLRSGTWAGDRPLAQEDGESERAFQARLARVDVTLQVRQ